MHWKPTPRSPQAHNNSQLLKNSRISEGSTVADKSKHFNTSFEIDTSFTDSVKDRNISFITTVTTPIRAKILEKKMQQNRPDQTKKQYLIKVLMNRMLNVRLAFKEMEALPTIPFKKGPSFAMAKDLIFKSKLSIETSILRTLIYAAESKKDINQKLKINRGQNVFVFPTSKEESTDKEKDAIIKLQQLVKIPIRDAMKQFKSNKKQEQAKIRYFNRVCSTFEFSRSIAFLKFKLLPNTKKTRGNSLRLRSQQLKLIVKIINKKSNSKAAYSFNCLKLYSWNVKFKQQFAVKKILTFAKLRKEMALKQWAVEAKNRKIEQERLILVEQNKLNALKKIVQRNYLKLFKEINRRIFNFRIVAIRLGAYSKINEQKSLWRLLTHMQSGCSN